MSSTRKAPAGQPLRQERYCSAVEYDEGLKALPVAKRAELIADADVRALIWFLQFRSLPPREQGIGRIGGMSRIAEEIFPYVHAAVAARGGITREDVDSNVETYRPRMADAEWRAGVVAAVANALRDYCINPARRVFPSLCASYRGVATTHEPDLPGHEFLAVLQGYRSDVVAGASSSTAKTEVSRRVEAMLSFTFESGRACLVEGVPRTGKTSAAKAFCEAHPGLARYIVTPPGVAEQDLLRAVADAIGVADSSAYKNVQIRAAVEEVLRRSRLALVFDEAQWLIGQNVRVRGMPQRLLWVKQLIDWSVPVAFVALPDFSRLLKNVGAKTGWPIEQITGRVAFESLPSELSEADLRAIFECHMPNADSASADLVVGCAMQDRDQAGAIGKVVDLAGFLCRRRGGKEPQFEDFKAAVLSHHRPSQSVVRVQSPRATSADTPRTGRDGSARALPSGDLGGRLGRPEHIPSV